jgi:hypothetical protein
MQDPDHVIRVCVGEPHAESLRQLSNKKSIKIKPKKQKPKNCFYNSTLKIQNQKNLLPNVLNPKNQKTKTKKSTKTKNPKK